MISYTYKDGVITMTAAVLREYVHRCSLTKEQRDQEDRAKNEPLVKASYERVYGKPYIPAGP